MRYAGFAGWEPTEEKYQVPDDGIRQLQDCDLWIFVSDRLALPVLPLKPIVLMVYDYLQRYVGILPYGASQPFIDAARRAERVFVTTQFNYCDALQFAGLDPRKVRKLPMLTPEFIEKPAPSSRGEIDYFIWTTNTAPHKNHVRAMEALRIYYEELGGKFDCWVTGTNTDEMLKHGASHLKKMAALVDSSRLLRERVKWRGELPDREYRQCLSSARFLWHAGQVDNGTFSVVEAAYFGVPALSSDYPAMREMDAEFSLNLMWMDPYSSRDMAEQIKKLEEHAESRRGLLPSPAVLAARCVETLAPHYWEEVRQCL
jgi:glycosyltransferase involved in cell wall biosynthesis